jgi:hypothetical protein
VQQLAQHTSFHRHSPMFLAFLKTPHNFRFWI